MTLHPSNRRWLVVVRDPGGHEVGRNNATAWVGTDQYDQRCEVLRRGLKPGETLDSTEADTEHQRLLVARADHHLANVAWLLGCVGKGPAVPHPGSLADYMPAEV